MILPSLHLVPKRDINGPDARRYDIRDTIYVSPSGKDGYLGYTPDLPMRSLATARDLSRRLNTSIDKPRYIKLKDGVYRDTMTFSYDDCNIFTSPLHVEKYSGRPVLQDSGAQHFTDITTTSEGLLKIRLSGSPFSYRTKMYLDNDRIYPARFPKEGAFYPVGAKINNGIYLKDNTSFCRALSTCITAGYNPVLVTGTDYNTSMIRLPIVGVSLSANTNNIYIIDVTGSIPNYGVSILPSDGYSNLPSNFSQNAHFFCTKPGEFVVSYEDSVYYVYVKPYNINSRVLTAGGTSVGITLGGAENIFIKDLAVKYFNTGIRVSNHSRSCNISGCTIEKNNYGITLNESANARIYKNLIFDHTFHGINVQTLSGAIIDNNIIMYSGLAATGNNGAGYVARAIGFGENRSMGDKPLVDATINTFTLNIDDIPSTTDGQSKILYSFGYDFDGYLEVKSGSLSGQRRMCAGYLRNDSTTATYSIKDPWTPVGDILHPSPGDLVSYTAGFRNRKSKRNIIRNNYMKYAGYSVFHHVWSFVDVISGNYLSNNGYGFTNDMGTLYMGFGGGVSTDDRTYIHYNIAKNSRQTPGLSNGNTLYVEGQGRFADWHHNIVDTGGSLLLSNEMCTTNIYNNIFLNGMGTMRNPREIQRTQFNYTVNNINTIRQSSDFYGLSCWNNIWYATSGMMPALYPELNYTYQSITKNMPPQIAAASWMHTSRVVHTSPLPSNNEAFRIITDVSSGSLSGYNIQFNFGSPVDFYYHNKGITLRLSDLSYRTILFQVDSTEITQPVDWVVPLSSTYTREQITSTFAEYISTSANNEDINLISNINVSGNNVFVNLSGLIPINNAYSLAGAAYSVNTYGGYNANWGGGSFYHMRGGVCENRPMYTRTENRDRFYVRGGNWVYGNTNMLTTNILVSSNCGVDGYNYPWQVPSSAWFLRGFPERLVFPSFETRYTTKRNVPFYSSDRNCYFTKLTSVTDYNLLSTDYNAYHCSYTNRNIDGTIFSEGADVASFSGLYNWANTSANVFPLSTDFETLATWEDDTIFADPKLNFETYQVAEDSPVIDLGFENIDTSLIGLRADGDPDWINIPNTLTSHPIYGSADWSEFKYGNHNELEP